METSNLTLEISQVITVIVTIGGLLKIWYSMKEKLALQNKDVKQLQNDYKEVKKEFEELEREVMNNKEKVGTMYIETKQEIHDLKLYMEQTKNEIITAINAKKK